MTNEWLQNIKPGDIVLYTAGFHDGYRKATVERLTKTMVILDGRGRYNRKDGYAVGSGSVYMRSHLVEPTPENIEKYERRSVIDKLKHAKWVELSTEQLKYIGRILDGQE